MTKKTSVLIIDDDEFVVNFLTKFLSHEGYESKVAYNGKIAMTLLKEKEYDAVLLDLKMPVMDGLTVIEKLKSFRKKPAIIVFTGVDKREINEKKLKKSGVYTIIYKPYRIEEVRKVLRKALKLKSITESKKKLLLVDDEITVIKSLSKILKEEEYDVITAMDGDEAIEKFDSQEYDAVLLDLKMKGLDGMEILKYIKKKNKDVPVILLSAFLTINVIEEAVNMGIYGYIRKPYELKELKEMIKRAIIRRQY